MAYCRPRHATYRKTVQTINMYKLLLLLLLSLFSFTEENSLGTHTSNFHTVVLFVNCWLLNTSCGICRLCLCHFITGCRKFKSTRYMCSLMAWFSWHFHENRSVGSKSYKGIRWRINAGKKRLTFSWKSVSWFKNLKGDMVTHNFRRKAVSQHFVFIKAR
jgi:hypothetical protein